MRNRASTDGENAGKRFGGSGLPKPNGKNAISGTARTSALSFPTTSSSFSPVSGLPLTGLFFVLNKMAVQK